MNARDAFKRGNAEEWTLARVGELSVQDQLRDNAERLNEPSVVELCRAALQDARSSRGRALRKPGPRTRAGRLIARVKAFEARSVFLQDARTSWSGVRKADGKVVMALWADAVEMPEALAYLLWAPNVPARGRGPTSPLAGNAWSIASARWSSGAPKGCSSTARASPRTCPKIRHSKSTALTRRPCSPSKWNRSARNSGRSGARRRPHPASSADRGESPGSACLLSHRWR